MGTFLRTGQMKEGELCFQKLIERSRSGVILMDKDLKMIYVSQPAHRIIEWNGAEINFANLIHPDDVGFLQNSQPGKHIDTRLRIKQSTGDYILVDGTLNNLLNETDVEAIVFNFVDATSQVELELEQKRREQVALEYAAFTRQITDYMPALLAYFSADQCCVFANKPYEEYFGAGQSVIGKFIAELLPPDFYNDQKEYINDVLGGKHRSFEHSMPGREDKSLSTYVQYFPDGPPGHIKGFYWLAYDISESKAADAEDKRKLSVMEELLDGITDGIVSADADQRYIYVNKRLGELVGLAPEKLIGRSMWEVFPNAIGSVTYNSIQEALTENRYLSSDDYYAPLQLWQENRIYPRINGFSLIIQDITGRKQDDEQLRLLFDRAPDMVGIIGIDRRFKRVNPAMCYQLGYTENELLGISLDSLVHPDDIEISRERTKAFIAAGDQTMYFENRFLSKTGVVIWLSWTVSRSRGETVMFCMGKNISDKKEMESMLQKANQLARIGGWEVDRVNGTAYWSPITREIYDVPESFVPSSENWLSFYREGPDRDYIAGKMAGTIATGIPCDAEVELTTAKGRTVWVRAIAEAEFKNGVCVRVYGSFQDIDDRKKAELAAISALSERNSILDSIGDGFFAVNRDWIVTYWNAAAEKIMDKPRDEMLGAYFWTIYEDVLDLDFYKYYKEAFETGIARHFEAYYPPIDTWFSVHAYPSEQGLSVFFRDITENKKSTEALAESEKRYSDLFQLSPLPMFVYDMKTLKYLDVNAAAIKHYGYNRDEFMSMTILEIRPEEDIELVRQTVAEQQENEKVILHGIFQHKKKSGEIIQVDIQSNRIVYKGISAKVVLAIDVTERMLYIKAIEDQNKKMTDISWMQSHVIRAPLSRIMGLLPMLKDYPGDDPDQQLIYEYLKASANELDLVIRSITDSSKVVDVRKE